MQEHFTLIHWILFSSFVIIMLMLDLILIQKKELNRNWKSALRWVACWISLALIFTYYLYLIPGPRYAAEFITGYVIEWTLSVDNLFVFIIIFRYFNVPDKMQHKILLWGIMGALILRGLLIATGIFMIRQFDWIIYIFGLILIITSFRIMFSKEEKGSAKDNRIIRIARRIIPVNSDYHNDRFIYKHAGKLFFTPAFLVLAVVEFTDLLFALDSIPAVLAITRNPFIVFTSNIFAILGLRSLYFALSGLLDLFAYLKYGLAIILFFIGLKMIAGNTYHIPITFSLAFVISVLFISIMLSLAAGKRKKRQA